MTVYLAAFKGTHRD